jgi:hypothetical protein
MTSLEICYTATNNRLFGCNIALMNDAFNASESEGELAHLRPFAEVIAGRLQFMPNDSIHHTAVVVDDD